MEGTFHTEQLRKTRGSRERNLNKRTGVTGGHNGGHAKRAEQTDTFIRLLCSFCRSQLGGRGKTVLVNLA